MKHDTGGFTLRLCPPLTPQAALTQHGLCGPPPDQAVCHSGRGCGHPHVPVCLPSLWLLGSGRFAKQANRRTELQSEGLAGTAGLPTDSRSGAPTAPVRCTRPQELSIRGPEVRAVTRAGWGV